MAFTGNKHNDDSNEVDSGIDFLKPKKDVRAEFRTDPFGAEMAQKDAFQYTLKTLNAIKIVAPVISALLRNPGLDASNDDLSASFKTIISELSELSEKICQNIGIDYKQERNFWIRNSIEKTLSSVLKEQWLAFGKLNSDSILKLVSQIDETIVEACPEKLHYEDLSDEASVKYSVIRAIMPIFSEFQKNSLLRDFEKDVEPISEKLFLTAKDGVDKLADDFADSEARAKLFSMLIQEAGRLYAVLWHAEASRIDAIAAGYSPDKVKATIDKYKNSGGFPLSKIDSDFDKYFPRIVMTAEKLVSSSKTGAANRLRQ